MGRKYSYEVRAVDGVAPALTDYITANAINHSCKSYRDMWNGNGDSLVLFLRSIATNAQIIVTESEGGEMTWWRVSAEGWYEYSPPAAPFGENRPSDKDGGARIASAMCR